MKECTFQPKLKPVNPDVTSRSTISTQPKYEELYTKAKPQIMKTDKTKQDYEFERQ